MIKCKKMKNPENNFANRPLNEEKTGRLSLGEIERIVKEKDVSMKTLEKMIDQYETLIQSVCYKIVYSMRLDSLSYEDLVVVAKIEMENAIKKCDPDKSRQFTNYLKAYLSSVVKTYIQKYDRSIRIPKRELTKMNKINRARREIVQEKEINENGVRVEDIAERSGISRKCVVQTLGRWNQTSRFISVELLREIENQDDGDILYDCAG